MSRPNILKLFHPLVAQPFYFFPQQTLYGNSPTGTRKWTSNIGGAWKIAIFDRYFALSRK